MGKVLIFDQDYLDIHLQDMDAGSIIVCHDPQKRLNNDEYKTTWGVLIHYDNSPEPKGLFWDKDMAVLFADKLDE